VRFSPILRFHVFAGTSGLLSGAVAVSFRKGSRQHGLAGKVCSGRHSNVLPAED
jgi:hypothetical protein